MDTVVVAFSSRAGIWGECLTIHFSHALFFFFLLEVRSRRLIPLFRPESVLSDSAR